MSTLNIKKLNTYLLESQKNKIYMFWKDNKIFTEKLTQNDYQIKNIVEKTHNSFRVNTLSGKKMNILLRWKNGVGIAFPAFQIKYIR